MAKYHPNLSSQVLKFAGPGLWALLIVGAFVGLNYYKTRPGAAGPVTGLGQLPQRQLNSRTQLLIFLHPKCECSRATLAELGDLIQTLEPEKRPDVSAYFYYPDTKTPDWAEHSDYWKTAQQSYHWNTVADRGGRQAYRWGARTSGHVLALNQANELLFSGGVTESRGHRGENTGKQLLKSVLSNPVSVTALRIPSSPIFGCGLFSANELNQLKGELK